MNAYDFPALRAQIDMLESINRQQADRIAELEKEVTRLVGSEPITYAPIYQITPDMIGAKLGLEPKRRKKNK